MKPHQQEKADHVLVVGIDGVKRPKHVEDELNESVDMLFASPVGNFVWDYLRSITLNRVSAQGSAEADLRELEGQRRLFVYLQQRRDAHERARNSVNRKDDK
jgi:hypothetical protein